MNFLELESDPLKERTLKGFGSRLAALRRSRGLTQAELGKATGISRRMIVYYEQENAQPPGPALVEMAVALGVTTDELLGVKPLRSPTSPRTARLLKRLQNIEKLPPADQRAVLKFVDGLLARAELEQIKRSPAKRRQAA